MRIVHSAFVTLLAVSAVPSSGLAQVLSLDHGGHRYSFDHAVPVATVSLVGDIVALDDARVVKDSYGEPFVLGAATLDVSVPHLAKIVFKMTNATETPIKLKDVLVYARTMVSAKDLRGTTVGAPHMPMSAAGVLAGYPPLGEELQPSATLTVEFPIPPPSCGKGGCLAAGFVVFVGRKLPSAPKELDPNGNAWLGNNRPPHPELSTGPSGRAWVGENPLFTRAFSALLSQAPRPTTSPF